MDNANWAGMITIVKLGPGNKVQISVNGKHSSVNRTIKLWNRLPVEALSTFLCKSHIFRKRVRKVIISEERWRVFEAWWQNVQTCREVKNREWSVVKCSEVMWSAVKWSNVMRSEVQWSEVMWSGVKWSNVMRSEVQWSEVMWSGVKCSEVKQCDAKWSAVKWSGVKWWSWVKCVYNHWFTVM